MGIYCQEIENKFKSFDELDNHLQKYDNYTYHIQLYIVPEQVYKRYSEIKASGKSNHEQYTTIKQLLSNNKVILAESGVTPNYDIQSFKMVMLPPVTKENKDMVMTSAEMTLVEVDGASFMNKVAIASMAAGWNSFVNCPVFIELWFEGYENRTGKVVPRIPFEWSSNEILNASKSTEGVFIENLDTYIVSCVMTGTSSTQELDKTTYKLKFYPYFYSSVNKDLQIISDLQPVKLPEDESTLGQVLQILENKLNERMLDVYGKEIYQTVYSSASGDKNSIKPIEIIFDGGSNGEEATNEIKQAFLGSKNRVQKFSDEGGWDEAVSNSNYKELSIAAEESATDNLEDAKALNSDLEWYWKPFVFGKIALNTTFNFGRGSGRALATEAVIRAQQVTHWYRYFFGKEYDTDGCKDLTDYVKKVLIDYCVEEISRQYGLSVFIEYRPVYIKEFLNKKYYKHNIIIRLRKVCGLVDMLKYQFNPIENPEQPVHYTDEPISKQLNYWEDINNCGLLHKKYNWLFSGKETNVLDVNYADNNLWYMNIGISNLNMIDNSTWVNKPKIDNETSKKEISSKLSSYDEEEIINANYKSDALKSIKGIIYADDLYELFVKDGEGFAIKSGFNPKKDKKAKVYNRIYNIIEANDPTTEIKPIGGFEKEDEKTDKESDIYKIKMQIKKGEVAYLIGMTNIFQYGGQRLKVNLNIIGDPEWLLPSSEFGPIEFMFRNDINYMPHILLCTKNVRSKDGMDEYRKDPLMELNTLYVITQVTSTFEGGKFLQNLEGYVATPFVQSSNDAVASEKYQKKLQQQQQQRAETTDAVPAEGN